MSRTLVPLLLVGLLVGPLQAEAGDDAEAEPAALVAAWLEATGAERTAGARRLRALGPRVAPALRAAAARAETAARARVEALLAQVREDHHRASVPAGMVYVPAGALEVPREQAPWGPSGTRREVPAFYLGTTEVTVGAWRAWLARLEAAEPGSVRRRGLPRPAAGEDERLPVTGVRHKEAEQFAADADARLPTADEFERALRGSGLATWPWRGPLHRGLANLRDYGPGHPVAVGSHPDGASPFGVLDLVGNVAEWSATAVSQGRRGRYPLLLGGSYIDPPEAALTWRGLPRGRARVGPFERQPWVGFRLARDVPPLPR